MEFDEDIVDYQGEHEIDESWVDQTWTDPWVENDLQDRKTKLKEKYERP